MGQVYFIADLHCGLGSCRTLAQRGFKTDWLAHTNLIQERINKTCDKCDLLYILGDLGFKDDLVGLRNFLSALNCRIKVCIGNHDNKKYLEQLKVDSVIEDVKESYNIKVGNYSFHLSHFPKREWEGFFRNGYHLYGHTHGQLPQYLRSMDVGIDNIGYSPISYLEVVRRLFKFNNIDERGKRIDL